MNPRVFGPQGSAEGLGAFAAPKRATHLPKTWAAQMTDTFVPIRAAKGIYARQNRPPRPGIVAICWIALHFGKES
jgi:hypothetical protein